MLKQRSRIYHSVNAIILAVAVCWVLEIIKVPVAWLIGSLVAGIGYALTNGGPKPLPRQLLIIGKAIIGVAAAARFSPANLQTVATHILPLLLALSITAALSMLNGYLIARWSGIKLVTGLLGAIPGTASANVAISSEFGADPPVVAVLQYLRLLMVVLLVPIVAGMLPAPATVADTIASSLAAATATVSPIQNLVAISLCGALGIWAGTTLRIPTKEFLGAFLCSLPLFGLFPNQYDVPRPLVVVGLLLIGLTAGLKFDWENVAGLGRAVLVEVVLVLLLILCCLGIGYGFHYFTRVDLTTAILAFAPGGMEAMIATSNQLGSDTGLVLTIKFIHQLSIIFTVNFIRSYLLPVQSPTPS